MFGHFRVRLALEELPFPEGRVHVSHRCRDSVTGSSVRDQHHGGRWWPGGPRGDGLFLLPAGSTQTRHIPEDGPSGFHLQSVSKLLLVISCV